MKRIPLSAIFAAAALILWTVAYSSDRIAIAHATEPAAYPAFGIDQNLEQRMEIHEWRDRTHLRDWRAQVQENLAAAEQSHDPGAPQVIANDRAAFVRIDQRLRELSAQ